MKFRDAFRDWRERANVRRDAIKLVLLGLAAGLGVTTFLGIGLFNVAASSGHWKVTDWLLHTVMRQSVQYHAMGIEVPPLDDAGLVQAGAGHFESGCAPCHGSPAAPRNPVVLEMTPHPPSLDTQVASWDANELFWIVKHGIKFTGMPAWPARMREVDDGHVRDVEIWSLVAFLQQLPDMTAARYDSLAFGPVDRPGAIEASARPRGLSDPFTTMVENCARCHGLDGRGRGSAVIPRLDMQRETYLLASLEAYAQGTRPSGIMQLQASGLGPDEMRRLAAHFAGLEAGPVDPGTSFVDPELVAAGRRIATAGVPDRKIPACESCHGTTGAQRKPLFPALAGQRREYLEWQLELWRAEKRGGTEYAHLMEAVARNLEDEDIAALAAFYASQPPGAHATRRDPATLPLEAD